MKYRSDTFLSMLHPLIPEKTFKDIQTKAAAIDYVLNLHYTSHISDPVFSDLRSKAENLVQQRIRDDEFESILGIWPEAYRFYYGSNGKMYISFSSTTTTAVTPRKELFKQQMDRWIAGNQQNETIATVSLHEIASKNRKTALPSKVTKPKRSSLANELKNDSSKFAFHQRDELVEQQKNNGLTLLERIRLKEKTNQKEKISPEAKYQNYLQGKATTIYDIVYQLTSGDEQPKSVALKKLCEVVQDSLDHPTNVDEISDTLAFIEKKLTDKFTIVKRSNLTVLKVGTLIRDDDLRVLNNE